MTLSISDKHLNHEYPYLEVADESFMDYANVIDEVENKLEQEVGTPRCEGVGMVQAI